MEFNDVLDLITAHTRYDVKCECGEFLLKRELGLMSSRDQWELHIAKVLYEHF